MEILNTTHKMITNVIEDRMAVFVSDLAICGCLGGFILSGWIVTNTSTGIRLTSTDNQPHLTAYVVKGGWEFVESKNYE